MSDISAELPPEVTVLPYAQDGYTGQEWLFENTPVSEMGMTDGTLSISHEGSEYVVSGLLDLTPEALGMTQDQLDTAGLDSSTVDIKVIITFPGEVIDTTGVIDGQTVTWTATYGEILSIDARADDGGASTTTDDATDEPTDEASDDATDEPTKKSTTKTSKADKDEDGGAGWILPVGIGVGALALIGVVLWLVLRGRNNGGPGGPGAPVGYGAQQPWGGQPGQQAPGAQQQGQQQWGQPGQPGQAPGPWGAPQQGQPGQQWGQPQQGQPQPGQQWGQPDQTQQWGQPQQPGQAPGHAPGQAPQGQPGQPWGQPQAPQQGQPGQPPQPGQPEPPQWGKPQ